MNDNISTLYGALKKKGYTDIGKDETEFRNWLGKDGNVKVLHSALSKQGFDDIGDESTFTEWVGIKPKKVTEPYTHVYDNNGNLVGGTAYKPEESNKEAETVSQLNTTKPYVPNQWDAMYDQKNFIPRAQEERRIDEVFKNKEAKSAEDVYNIYSGRFSHTPEGIAAVEERAKAAKAVQEKYMNEYLASPEFAELSKMYKGEELQKQADEQFNLMYGDWIDYELQPANKKYAEAVNARYGESINRDLNRVAKNDAASELEVISKTADEAMDALDERINKRKKQLRNDWRPNMPMNEARNDNELAELNAERTYLSTAQNLNKDSKKIVEAAKKEKDGTFVGGLGRGVADSMFDIDTWTMGLTGMFDEMALNKVLSKAEKGEKLNEAEQSLLDACVNNMAINFYYGSDLGYGYQAGKITGESLPFMLEFLINPISASGNAIAKSLLSYGVKRFGVKTIGKNATKATARFLGDALAAGGVTATTGMGTVLEGGYERLNRNYSFDRDNNGNLVVNNNGRYSTAEAFGKSALSNYLERQSEMIFNAFRPLKGKPLNTLAERMQWHGLAEEYMEEVYNNFSNIPLGEMTLEEATSLENNLVTFLGLAPTQVVFSSIGGVGYAVERYNAKKKIREAYGALTPEQQNKLKKLEELAKERKNRDIAIFLSETLKDESLTPEQKRAELEYAYSLAVENAIADAEEAEIEESVAADNAHIDAVTDTSTGLYGEVMLKGVDESGNETQKPANVIQEKEQDGELFLLVQEEGSNERKWVRPSEYIADSYQRMNAEEAKALNEEATRAEAAERAELESKYDPRVLESKMEQGKPVDTPNARYIPIVPMAEGTGWQVEVYPIGKDGKYAEKPESIAEVTTEEYRDMLQAQLDAEEAVAKQEEKLNPNVPAPTVGTSFDNGGELVTVVDFDAEGNPFVVPTEEYEQAKDNAAKMNALIMQAQELGALPIEQYNNAVEAQIAQEESAIGNELKPVEAATAETEQPAVTEEASVATESPKAEEVKQAPAIPTKEDGSIDFVAYGKDNTFKELGNKYGEKMPNKVAVTAKAYAEDVIKAQEKLAKAEEAYDNAPIGREGKALEARDKAKTELEAVQREANFWAEMDADIKAAQAAREAALNPQVEVGSEEPMTADEFIAQQIANGNIVLRADSYKKETGYGETERRKFMPMFRKAENGGMTIEEAGERLMEMDRENGTNFFDQTDANAGRDALINFLQSVQIWGDVTGYIRNNREYQAQRDAEALRDEHENQVMAAHYASLEDYVLQNEAAEVDNPFEGFDIATKYAIFAEAEEEYQRYLKEQENGQTEGNIAEGSGSVLSEEQADNTRRTEERQEQGDGISQRAVQESEGTYAEEQEVSEEELRRRPLRDRINEWAKALGIKVHIIESVDEAPTASIKAVIENAHKEGQVASGWISGGEAYFFLPDLTDVDDVDKTFVHEVVAHIGMEKLLGKERFDALCDKVWEMMPQKEKDFFTQKYPIVKDMEGIEQRRAAADEYIAHLAEKEDLIPEEKTIWDNIVKFFRDALEKMLGDIIGKSNITNEDISNLIKASYANLKSRANEDVVGEGTKFRLSSSNKSVAQYDKENGTDVKGFFDYLRNGKKGKANNFHIANAGELLEKYGIKGKFMVGDFTFSKTHTQDSDHELGVKEWVDILNNINNPLAIASYKGLPNEYRIYTYAKINGTTICLGVNVSAKEGKIVLSRIISAYGRDINKLLGNEKNNLIYPTIDELKRRILQGSTAPNSLLNAKSTASADKDSAYNSEKQEKKPSFRVKKDKNDLVAVHNISENNLKKVLDMGGLIMPSIAITKADMGHEEYGSISLLFDKETINPSDRRNKVYGGDAWTPRFPQVSAKISDKVSSRVYKKIRELISDRVLSENYSLSAEMHPDNIERTISNNGVEGYYGKEYMKLAYLLDNGKKVKTPMKMKDYGENSEAIIQLAKEKELKMSDIQQNGFDFYENNADFVEAVQKIVNERKLNSLPEEQRDALRKLLGAKKMTFSHFDTLISQATRMEYDLEHGGLKKILDRASLRESIERKVKTNNADYNKWVDSLFDGIVEKYGIRNNRDWYTPSGNLRPWEQLYDNATPANILKHMLAENEQGGSGGFFDSNIMGASAETYESIEEIREKGKKRLRRLEDGEYDEWSNSISERMSEICNDFLSPSQRKEFGAAIDSKIDITNAVAKDKTSDGIYKAMKRKYPAFKKEHAKKVEEIVKEIQDFAIGYFEAKPRRIVSLSEVKKAIVPSNTNKDIINGLKNNGVEVVTYRSGNEASRAKLIQKESNGIRFRIANRNQEIFVSNAAKAVEGIKQEKATPQQWLAMIEKNGGLKAGEDKWIGLSEWLNASDAKTLTKDDVLNFVNQNKIVIEEVKYSGDDINSTRLEYTTEGLENKQEIALTIPTIEPWNVNDEVHFGDAGEGRAVVWMRFGETTIEDKELAEKSKILGSKEWWNMSDEERKAVMDELKELKQNSKPTRVLVIDEIQSKRHQEGREKGYFDVKEYRKEVDRLQENLDNLIDERRELLKRFNEKYDYKWLKKEEWKENGYMMQRLVADETVLNPEEYKEITSAESSLKEARKELSEYQLRDVKDRIPSAPFEKNWSELAMKRMLRYAAENGFDKVAWTKGEQQAERYSLSKVVDSIECNRVGKNGNKSFVFRGLDYNVISNNEGVVVAGVAEFKGKQLSEIVGTSLAEKMLGMEEGDVIDNTDLRFGGEGMKGFYDKMLPSFVNKYVKKWGTKVQDIELPNLEESGRIMHSVDVTDAMKESVMEGQVMFRISAHGKNVKAEVDKFTSKYDGADVAFFDGEMTDEEVSSVIDVLNAADVKDIIKKGILGGYSDKYDRISIFADNNVADGVEDTLFHENLHRLLKNRRSIVEAFSEKSLKRFPKNVEHLQEEGYEDGKIPEELLVRLTAKAMSYGIFDDVRHSLPESEFEELKNLISEIGYEYEREIKSRALEEGRRGTSSLLEGEEIHETRRDGRTSKESEGEKQSERAERLTQLFGKVADMGLNGVLGNKEYTSAMVDIYKAMPEDVRAELADDALRNYGGSIAPAVSDYLNVKGNANIWDKVVGIIKNALRKIGIDVDLTANDVKYMIWRSNKPLDRSDILDVAEDIDKKYKLKVGEYSPTRFSVAPSGKLNIRDQYEAKVKKSGYQAREAVQDAMLSLRRVQEMIEKESGEKLRSFENAWMHENRLSSVTQAEIHEMERQYHKPMMKAVEKLMKASGYELSEVADYMMMKHGIERNREMAVRKALTDADGKIDRTKLQQWYQDKEAIRNDASLPTWREKQEAMDIAALNYGADMSRDYSGLTSIFGTDDVADALNEAYKEVETMENMNTSETAELWKRVKAMNQNMLDATFSGGLMSREVYDELSKDMYDYYIPLRGFEETTSDEVYSYLDNERNAFNSPLKRAKGRSSKADNPLAYMKSMAESGIMQSNRNKMKQTFLNMVVNHPSDLVSVREGVWVQFNPVSGEWEAVSANLSSLPHDATPADVEAAFDAWEANMEAQAAVDPNIKKVFEGSDVPYRVLGNKMNQHQIVVKRNGKSYTLTVNGNPRLAMAINGLTNPNNTSNDGKVSAFVTNKIGEANRFLSSVYTTKNPDFVASNFMRDTFYTNTIVRAKEGNKYANKFHKNYANLLMPNRMMSLFNKYNNGKLDMSDELEKNFYDFMMNGGETGYSNLKDLEEIKKQIAKEAKGNRLLKLQELADRIDVVNRAVENTARFAAFLTSREMGRDIATSVFDAKEISVNFNKKGSGGTFFGATGQTRFGNLASAVGASGRAMYVFFNAAIQGTTNLLHVWKGNKVGTTAGLGAMFLMGALVPYLLSGDDDKDYYDIPEYIRRSNLILPSFGDSWISIPLPIEYRIVYGMGELFQSWRLGHEKGSDIAKKMFSLAGQALPLNFLEEGVDVFMPSFLSPAWQVFNNKSWTGLPIYKESDFNKDDPNYTKAYSNTNKNLVAISKALYEWTYNDETHQSWLDLNPAAIEYLAKGYFGGLVTTFDNVMKTYEMIQGEREMDWRNIPIANRIVKSGDERTKSKRIQNEYFENIEHLDRIKSRERLLKKVAEGAAVPDEDKKKADKDLNKLYNSEVFKKFEDFREIKKEIDKVRKELKSVGSNEELEKVLSELQEEANKAVK